MNSHKNSDNLLDLRLQHTLKNMVAHKEVPAKGRERLLAAAVLQGILPKESHCFPEKKGKRFYSQRAFLERTICPGQGHALDTIYVLKASMLIA